MSFFDEEVERFTRLAASGIAEFEIEAAQGFYHLKHPSGEDALVPLATSRSADVRLQAVKALGTCGGRRSVEVLIDSLADTDWEVREAAGDALERMTAESPFHDRPAALAWLKASSWSEKEAALVRRLGGADVLEALEALEALRYVGSPAVEDAILLRLPKLGPDGFRLAVGTLERVGTTKSLPALVALVNHLPDASWALAEIGGPEAEQALFNAMLRWRNTRLDCMLNLDRLGSTKCGPYTPMLLQTFGLVIYRSRTDELQFGPTAFQRVAANLVLRSGDSQKIVHLVLAECENNRSVEETPPHLRTMLANMKTELASGFVRNDSGTVALPLAALPHIIRERRFVPRLIGLLDHPAYIVRIYAAECLASLKAHEGVAPILRVIRTPYDFPDSTRQVSGKHFDHSKYVRWRGYLPIALGKLGGHEAREALEQLALDEKTYRDTRYGAVVGLRFLASPESLPALEKVARDDIIREIRMEAHSAIRQIELTGRLAADQQQSN